MTITFTLNGTTTLDESSGLQSATATPNVTGDSNDNDVALSTLQTQVASFYNRLFGAAGSGGLALLTTFPTAEGVAVSPDNFLQISATGTISNVAFTDANGAALNGADSGLNTTSDNADILLYTDSTNDNIVLGRASTDNRIVFAAYLQEVYTNNVLSGVKIWMVTFDAIDHLNTGSYDESIAILANKLFVSASEQLNFDLNTLASGQNAWNAFGDSANQIIVISDQTDQTVNTSKGGGSTTIGNTNQLLDGVDPAKDANGESMVFTFVKNSPSLLTLDKSTTSDIDFNTFLNARSVEWSISQTQGGAPFAVASIRAALTSKETGTAFGTTGLQNDTTVQIKSVTIKDGSGQTLLAAVDNDLTPGTVETDTVSRNLGKGGNAITFDLSVTFNADGTVKISGLEAKDVISYTTVSDHNRTTLTNSGNDATSLDWDIGGFKLLEVASSHQDVGPALLIEDSGPSIITGGTLPALTVDESDLTTDATGSFANNFFKNYGTDGGTAVAYALSVVAGASGLIDTATNSAVNLSLNGTVVEGRSATGDNLVFTVSVDSTGLVTLDQKRAVVHSDSTNPDDSTTLSAANLVKLTATITDGDGDQAAATLEIGQTLNFKDDGPSVSQTGQLPTLTVDETDLTTNASASFASNFSTAYGADGGSGVLYALSVVAGAAGLVDTATNSAVNLSLNGTVVEGRSATGNNLVFTVSVDSSGNVTLDQQRAVVHSNAANPDDSTTLSAANLVKLTALITDGDGDPASATINIGQSLIFKDDGPAITVNDISGPFTTALKTGTWTDSPGADGFKSLNITLDDYTIDSHSSVTANTSLGTATAPNNNGDFVFTGSITDDFTNDGIINTQTLNYTLTFHNNGNYDFQATSLPQSTTTLSSSAGQLDAGGPDPVRTLTIGTKDIVFSAVNALADPNQIKSFLNDSEQIIQSQATYLSPAAMNVSTSGIGLGDNLFEGNANAGVDGATTQGGKFDESFVVDPHFLVSGMKIFIDNSVGGYTPVTEGIYYRVYYSDGTVSQLSSKVTALTSEAGGQVSFFVGSTTGPNNIDAVQLLMGQGTVKVPVIQFTITQDNPAQSLAMNLTATITDKDNDPQHDTFAVDLIA